MSTALDEFGLFDEVRRLYLIDAHTDPDAANRYLEAIADVDAALHFIDSHENAWATIVAGSPEEQRLMGVLEKLTQEGLEFARSQKKGNQ